MKFSNLKGAEVSAESRVKYVFSDIEGSPWIEIRYAGGTNKGYLNAILKKNAKNKQRSRRGLADADQISNNRNEDRELYATHILTGNWGGWVNDETSAEVSFSKEAASELMTALPDYMFDDLRVYCNDPSNFRTDMVDADIAAKNS